MMRSIPCLTLLATIACHAPSRRAAENDDAAAIRGLRERSNRAIAAHDTAAMAAVWSDSLFVISSTGARADGRAAYTRLFANQFRARPDVRYVRTSERVQLYAPWEMAVEEGRWVGSWTEAGGRIQIGGRYLARWRREHGEWRIVAEVYAPTFCSGGAYCERRP